MKKLLAIAILAVLFAVNAYAQVTPGGYNDDKGYQEFYTTVICPIEVNPDDAEFTSNVNLGEIIPGSTRPYSGTPADINNALFYVNGQSGYTFSAVGKLTKGGRYDGSLGLSGNVTILNATWKWYDGSAWQTLTTTDDGTYIKFDQTNMATIPGTGCVSGSNGRQVKCTVTQFTASNDASAGKWAFPVSLEAVYVGL